MGSNLYPQFNNPRSTTGVYPGVYIGIDLRYEMGILLDEYGTFVILRHYDKTEHSNYWDNIAKEAIGGPAWPYRDYITRAREVIRETAVDTTAGLEIPTPMGLMTLPQVTFYIEWDVTKPDDISNSDELFRFKWTSSKTPSVDQGLDSVTNRYNILEAAPLLCDGGRIEYYNCICRTDVAGK